MSKEFIESEIDQAHAFIIEGAYDEAVNRLKLLKSRIPDAVASQEIESFESSHDKKLDERMQMIEGGNEDQLRKQYNGSVQWKKYAIAYLNFYSKLIHDYDL